ncbi:hypothetical protein BJX62DRAFT_196559 [Aspergillus germanicus]
MRNDASGLDIYCDLEIELGSFCPIIIEAIGTKWSCVLSSPSGPKRRSLSRSGRMATQFYHADQCRSDAPTGEWAAKAGALMFIFQRVRGASPSEATVTTRQVHDHLNKDAS